MKAIQLFQQQNKLESDGKIGKNTTAMMLSVWRISKLQLAHFLGQCHEESGGFELLEENLNYSAKGLQTEFLKYFTTIELANNYQKQPEKIANRVYANRMGNGTEESGDGYKFRGRGCIQTTGKNNYQLLSKYLKEDLIVNPELVATKYAFESALFYFNNNRIWNVCNEVTEDNIKKVTKLVNGGYTNLDKRIENTNYYFNLINS